MRMNNLWLSKNPFFYVSLCLCLLSAFAMIILHTYINTEFSYIDSLLHLQKGYNEVIPKLAQMRSAQQEYIQNKSDEAYNKFNNLFEKNNLIYPKINNIAD